MAVKDKHLRSVKDMKPRKIKRVSVSSKRQVSIPKEFYDELKIGSDVTMELVNNRLIIKPVGNTYEDFSEEILSDLINEGYSGNELIDQFKKRKSLIKPALNSMIAETKTEEYTTVDELFADDKEDKDDSN